MFKIIKKYNYNKTGRSSLYLVRVKEFEEEEGGGGGWVDRGMFGEEGERVERGPFRF